MAQLPYVQCADDAANQMQTKWRAILNPLLANSGTSSDVGFIGEVRAAFLTEAQFQNQAGPGWVLCNGQGITGSAYASMTGTNVVPDMRSTVPRMKDNGKGLNPAGDLGLGVYQQDQFQGHYHANTGQSYMTFGGGTTTGLFAPGSGVAAINQSPVSILGPSTDGVDGSPRYGMETCAKSTTINFFIRVN